MITISVDDKIAAARMIADMMKKLDPDGVHEVENDPQRAIGRIEQLHPDIVWLDIEMSVMNGLEMAALIKKRSPFSNIVFVTGHPEYARGFRRRKKTAIFFQDQTGAAVFFPTSTAQDAL